MTSSDQVARAGSAQLARRGRRTGTEDDACGLGGEDAVPARPDAGKVNCLAGLHGKGGPDRVLDILTGRSGALAALLKKKKLRRDRVPMREGLPVIN